MCDLATLDSATPEDASVLSDLLELYQFELRTIFALARGPDGRSTPSGRVLEGDDVNIDTTYGRDLMGPDEVGSHPRSVSLYGLYDTAGNAFEWTLGERPGTYVVRGGSYYHDAKTADLANRNETSPTIHEPTGGLRLCATLR